MSGRLRGSARPSLAVVAVVGLLALVALASGERDGLPGPSGPHETPAALVDYALTAGLLVVAGLLAVLAYVLLTSRGLVRRRGFAERLGSLLVLLLVVGALSFSLSTGHRLPLSNLPFGTSAPSPSAGPDADAVRRQTPGSYSPRFRWIVPAVLGGLLLGAGLVVAVTRRRPSEPEEAAVAEALAAEVAETLHDLRAEGDARRAIVAAYARMERALGAQGVARRPAEAPHEYLARVIGELARAPAPMAALTRLYERARFSEHRLGVGERNEAIAALETIRDELRYAA